MCEIFRDQYKTVLYINYIDQIVYYKASTKSKWATELQKNYLFYKHFILTGIIIMIVKKNNE